MSKHPIRRIGLILLLAFLLPALFFSAYELTNLSQQEEVLEDIYDQQLETVLYSVNSYAQDLVGSWRQKVYQNLQNGLETGGQEFIGKHPGVSGLLLMDSVEVSQFLWMDGGRWDSSSMTEAHWRPALQAKQEAFEKFYAYRENGFPKIAPFAFSPDSQQVMLGFLLPEKVEWVDFCGILIDVSDFVDSWLSPKLDATGNENFEMSLVDEASASCLFPPSGEPPATEVEASDYLWLFPKLKIAIHNSAGSIGEVVKRRFRWNLGMLLVMDAILILALWTVFRSIRKELRLSELKSEFVSNVSHEIRTPLALIRMFAETLEMNRVPTEEKKHEYYQIISQETRRLSGVVGKILNFSKMDKGKRVYHRKELALRELMNQTLYAYNFHLKQKGFTWTVEHADGPDTIFGDEDAISEVLINLLDNAVKYSEDNKELTFRTISQPGKIGFSVSDHGIGISLENQHSVFDQFFRVPTQGVHNVKGTGLGLSIVRQIVEDHGGSVAVASELGKGSTFTCWFPLKSEKSTG
ncbi:HAMP domain-containing sensor histidine kinase [Pontibacter sp. G13]|uniref:sensor histidine kinase n=1 Tax=Pontibacter sp. G13 TaxID=3074898 RepID=UPI00288C0699|nr:HAMP domain-containing sensor histidine kinase [Pontibacter sp. G13]WNJ20185.1 HAMP domain-containing sensor histidine kinase [Pontibacter sp. G13]